MADQIRLKNQSIPKSKYRSHIVSFYSIKFRVEWGFVSHPNTAEINPAFTRCNRIERIIIIKLFADFVGGIRPRVPQIEHTMCASRRGCLPGTNKNTPRAVGEGMQHGVIKTA